MPIKSICIDEIDKFIGAKLDMKIMAHEGSLHSVGYDIDDFDHIRRRIEDSKDKLRSCLRESAEKK